MPGSSGPSVVALDGRSAMSAANLVEAPPFPFTERQPQAEGGEDIPKRDSEHWQKTHPEALGLSAGTEVEGVDVNGRRCPEKRDKRLGGGGGQSAKKFQSICSSPRWTPKRVKSSGRPSR